MRLNASPHRRIALEDFEYDVVVIGQGLAGTTLAWHLHWLGQRVLVIDRQSAITASRVAAGLLTPITGQRFTVSWRFRELFAFAKCFYEQVETATGQAFFDCGPMVRLFANGEEEASFAAHGKNSEIASFIAARGQMVTDVSFRGDLAGFEMSPPRAWMCRRS